MSPRLPPATTGDWESEPKCPWCRAEVGAVTITLGALLEAHHFDELQHPASDRRLGTADSAALSADCASCARPFIVAIRGRNGPHGHRLMKLLPVRTDADLRLLGERP